MLIGLSFSVDFINHLFQSFVIHHVVLALLGIVRCCEDNEIRCKSIKNRRNSRKSMSTTGEIDIFLSQRQQELLHINAVAWTDVSLAVVEDEKAVDEVCLYILQDFLLAVADKSFRAFICAYSFRETRTNERDVFPFILVRRYDQRASFLFQCRFKYLAENCRLACAWFSDEHHFKNLTRRFRLCFRKLLFLRLRLLRIV